MEILLSVVFPDYCFERRISFSFLSLISRIIEIENWGFARFQKGELAGAVFTEEKVTGQVIEMTFTPRKAGML